jgi:hypothetical protein
MIKNIIIVVITLLTCGCAVSGSTTEAIHRDQQEQHMQQESRETPPQDETPPEWFNNVLPSDGIYFYASATSYSADMQFSVDKAEMNAKVQIAYKIQGIRFKSKTEILEELGEVDISGYSELKQKTVAQGLGYRTYIILKYPIARASRKGFSTARLM